MYDSLAGCCAGTHTYPRLARFYFFTNKSRFVRSTFSFSLVDLLLTLYGMFTGLLSALLSSVALQVFYNVLWYVRLDRPTGINFTSFAAVMKLDLSHNNPGTYRILQVR